MSVTDQVEPATSPPPGLLAWRAVVGFGAVSLAADMIYEGYPAGRRRDRRAGQRQHLRKRGYRYAAHAPTGLCQSAVQQPLLGGVGGELQALCAEAGVALVIEREITGARINGAVRWLPSERPLIQLSVRHRWADIFWFTFFHEAAHVLLHDRRRFTIVDGVDRPDADNAMENEADDFASRTLLPRSFDSRLATIRSQTQAIALAAEANVHPGVVVGRLQHDKTIPYSHFNRLRTRLAFTDDHP